MASRPGTAESVDSDVPALTATATERARRNVTFNDNEDAAAAAATAANAARDLRHAQGGSRKASATNVTATAAPPAGGAANEGPAPFFLTREEVQSAFEFFDLSGTGVLTLTTLKPRLAAFYPNLTSKEYRFLLEDPVNLSGGAAGAHHSAATGGSISAAPGATSGGSAGLTADQLWELIDTYQRLYLGHPTPARPYVHHAAAATTTTTAAAAGGAADEPTGAFTEESSGPLSRRGTVTNSRYSAGGSEMSTAGSVNVFDPVFEGFRVYDPTGRKKCVDVAALGQIMARIGYGELSDEELQLLVRTADFDGDGVVSLEDFRELVSAKGRRGAGGSRTSSVRKKRA